MRVPRRWGRREERVEILNQQTKKMKKKKKKTNMRLQLQSQGGLGSAQHASLSWLPPSQRCYATREKCKLGIQTRPLRLEASLHSWTHPPSPRCAHTSGPTP